MRVHRGGVYLPAKCADEMGANDGGVQVRRDSGQFGLTAVPARRLGW